MGRRHQRLAQPLVYEARDSWEWDAACIGRAELFFPGKGESGYVEAAKRICLEECPVFEECKAKVEREQPEYGVWAGTLYQPNGRKQ